MVLDTSLLNTQQYKVRIKGKVGQSWEKSSALLHLVVVAIEKGAFRSPLIKGRQLYFYFYLCSQSLYHMYMQFPNIQLPSQLRQ